MASVMATQLVIPALPTFYKQYPDVQLDLGVSDRPSDLIGEHIDCVLRAGTITDPSLIARHIGDLSQIICASPSYLRRGTPAHPVELEQGSHELMPYFFAGTGQRLEIVLKREEEERSVKGPYRMSCNDAKCSAGGGLAGLGIIGTLSIVARPYLDDGRLVQLLPDWTADTVPVSIVYALNRHLSARVGVFAEWLMQVFDADPQTRPARRAQRSSSAGNDQAGVTESPIFAVHRGSYVA